jgi:diacylglycerol kinase family enzyme
VSCIFVYENYLLIEIVITRRHQNPQISGFTPMLSGDSTEHRLFGHDTEHVIQTTAEQLTINGNSGDPIGFSLGGEIRTYEQLSLSVRRRALEVYVGPTYDPMGR